jgi:hypothetical protein
MSIPYCFFDPDNAFGSVLNKHGVDPSVSSAVWNSLIGVPIRQLFLKDLVCLVSFYKDKRKVVRVEGTSSRT